MPLVDAVDFVSDLSGLPVTFDPEAMQELGLALHDPVTVQRSGDTIGRILEATVSELGLAVVVENNQVLITSPPDWRDALRQTRYTVSDLSGGNPAAVAELAALLQSLVAPDSWQINGGRGTVELQEGALLAVQTGAVHHQVLVFCEKLRNARGKPLRSRLSADLFALATHRARARETLGRPVTVNFQEPAPLVEIVGYLEELTKADVLLDHAALGGAGTSAKADATLSIRKQPLGTALSRLLEPLGLDYRVIDAETLQITTRKAVASRLELEFYLVADLLAKGETGPALIERIKGRLAGSTWSDAGGPGVLHFDGPSGCLIVLQSQPVQAALEGLLAELRR
jgi:hypothetical protein